MGSSPGLDDLDGYRPTRLADLVGELTDRADIDRFAFVGWSWGASIGVHLAARHSDRLTALVLLDAGHTDIQDQPGWTESGLDELIAEFELDLVSFPSWEAFLDLARERATAWRPALEERLREGMHEQDGVVVARGDPEAAAAALYWAGAEPPSSTLPTLAGLELPILLVVASRNDTSAQVERFQSAVPRAATATIDSEHDLLAHAPEETAQVVADWLLEHARQPRVA